MSFDLSFIIPTHNAQETILDTLKSIVDGIGEKIKCQIIIVDDASTDNTVEKISSFNDYDKNNIKIELYPLKENVGAGKARNIAIPKVQGRFLAFIDADDTLNPNIIEPALNNCPDDVDVLFFKYHMIGESEDMFALDRDIFDTIYSQINDEKKFNIIDHPRILEFINVPWNKIYRTEFANKIQLRFGNVLLNEDIYPTWLGLIHARNIKLCPQALINYYRRNNGLSESEKSGIDRLQAIDALHEVKEMILKSETFAKEEKHVFNYTLLKFSSILFHWAHSIIDSEHKREFKQRARHFYTSFPLADFSADYHLLSSILFFLG